MKVTGVAELNQRLEATRATFLIASRLWADDTAELMRNAVPNKTGYLRHSFNVVASKKSARVKSARTAYPLDHGAVAHPIKPRKAKVLAWSSSGQPRFARSVEHPGQRARPFRARASAEALRKNPMADTLIQLWNLAQ